MSIFVNCQWDYVNKFSYVYLCILRLYTPRLFTNGNQLCQLTLCLSVYITIYTPEVVY
jgi:hypothetical protein